LPLLIVLALLVLAMFGGVVWLAYTQGVARGRGETPVLTAAAGPERVAPTQQGGGNVPYQGFKIYEQPAPPDDSADNAPGPAQVAPQPKLPEQPKAPEQPQPAPQAMAPAEAPKPAPPPQAAPKPTPAKQATAPAQQPKPVPAPQKPNSVAALIQQADSTTPKAAPKSVAAKPAAVPPVGPATGAPRQLGHPAAAPVTAAKPGATGGAYVLQIGAYKSQADANTAWAAYKARHAALLSGYSPDVKQADLGAKGTWYRLRVAGFGDREVAAALCERLKADGGACILAK